MHTPLFPNCRACGLFKKFLDVCEPETGAGLTLQHPYCASVRAGHGHVSLRDGRSSSSCEILFPVDTSPFCWISCRMLSPNNCRPSAGWQPLDSQIIRCQKPSVYLP